MKLTSTLKKSQPIILLLTLCFMLETSIEAQVPHPDLGLRAEWMRGTYGLNWKPGRSANGLSESEYFSIAEFLDQIKHLKTVDYIQIHLNESSVYSPVHVGPHDLIESFWQGNVDGNGDPINLVVPRASIGRDPFLDIINDIRAAGLKVQVYVNSSNLLRREGADSPDAFPNVTNRWMNWCDLSNSAQDFIDSQPYHVDPEWPNRKYMFCYAEFILKEYAIRYGDLIDAWCFDSGRYMWQFGGDNQDSDNVEEQRIYQAFADACHAGNPDAAIAFQNSPGANDMVNNPFTPATLFDDYMFGHPFSGGTDVGDHPQNYFILQWIAARDGYAHIDDGRTRTWDDKVIGHYDPPMSTTKWNTGSEPGVADSIFADYYATGILGNGAVSFGIPLVGRYNFVPGALICRDWGMKQLEMLDSLILIEQYPGAPNWARQATILPDAYMDRAYSFEITEGVDFWDPEGDAITGVSIVAEGNHPSWLSILESGTNPGTYILSGMPTETEAAEYTFKLRVEDASGGTDREVNLQVRAHPDGFLNPGDGTPVWISDTLILPNVKALESKSYILYPEIDFYDFEGDELAITKGAGFDWISIKELSNGRWQLSAAPNKADEGVNYFSLSLSDGTNSSETIIQLTVDPADPVVGDGYSRAQIQAAADSIYGVSTVATMISDTLSGPDDTATFQISIDVIPQDRKSIASGISGGLSTNKSWGLAGDNRELTKYYLFFGDSLDWVDIGNIQVINFNANGGELSLADFKELVFESITLVNAQSGNKDAVSLIENGVRRDLGNLADTPFTLDLKSNVEGFSIGNGYSPNQLANKWSVDDIQVKYYMGELHTLSLISENGSIVTVPDKTEYIPGTEVLLGANPDEGFKFDSWEGDVYGAVINGNTIKVIMDADRNITARFSPIEYSLSISSENGSVALSPDQETYDHGSQATLIAEADSGYRFDGWSGDTLNATIKGDTIIVVMEANRNISANFYLLEYALSITSENGSIELSPNQEIYDHGTEVLLVAKSDPDYQFDGWSGDTIGATIISDTLILVMIADKSITANFTPVIGIMQTESPASYTIWPNPSKGIFEVKMAQQEPCVFTVYSIRGEEVMQGLAEGQFEINLSSYKRGFYFLKIKTDRDLEVQKIILN